MKTSIKLAILLLSIAACSTTSKTDRLMHKPISENLVVDQIATDSYIIKDLSFYNSNVLVTKMSDGTVVIASSPIETVRTKNMLKWIESNLDPKRLLAINTHFHADGTGGNEAYHSVNAEIWSSKETASIYQKRADSMQLGLAKFVKNKNLSKLVMERKNLPATKVFEAKEGIEWTFGKEKVVVKFPGPAHSSDNIVVFFPERKILFGGCILRAMDWSSLGNLKDANVDKYYDSVKSLMNFNADIIIPGHGNIGDKNLITHTMALAKKAQQNK